MSTKIQKIDIRKIRLDGNTQARVKINEQTVADYAEAIANGEELPAIELYHDGSDYWPSDGFHRTLAHAKAGKEKVAAIVKMGTCDEAAWAALSKNQTHGLRLSREDRAKIIKDALRSRFGMSDRAIAKHIGVSQNTVAKYRKEIEPGVQLNTSENSDFAKSSDKKGETGQVPEKRVGTDGKKYPAQQAKKPKPKVYYNDPAPVKKQAKAPADEPTDQVGNRLPNRSEIREAFERRDEITEMMTMVSRLRSGVTKASESGDQLFAALTLSRFQADCGNIYRALRAIRPHAVCPYCKGAKKDCEACLGRGWVGEFTYEHAPADMKGAK